MKIVIDVKFFDEPNDEEPARTETIQASSEDEAVEKLQKAMKPWEKRADAEGFVLDEDQVSGDAKL